jgi:hypothetical protein
MAWESIAVEWRERVSKEAIAEAVRLPSQAFQDHAGQYVAAEYAAAPASVIVLDENIVDGQRLLLESWNIAARQVGLDVGCEGVKDEEIVGVVTPLPSTHVLHARPGVLHPGASTLALREHRGRFGQYELAAFVRRILHHPEFATHVFCADFNQSEPS